MGSSISHREAVAKPQLPPEVLLQGLARWWSGLDRPYRFNVGLYVLAAMALGAMLFEVATGSDTSPKEQVATQSPTSSTVRPTSTTSPPTTTPNAPASTSSTVDPSTTTVATIPSGGTG